MRRVPGAKTPLPVGEISGERDAGERRVGAKAKPDPDGIDGDAVNSALCTEDRHGDIADEEMQRPYHLCSEQCPERFDLTRATALHSLTYPAARGRRTHTGR